MKTLSNIILAAAFLGASGSARSEDEREYGFIRLVHAVAAGEGRLTLHLDGANVYPSGYELGNATGGIGVGVGRREVEIERDGVENGETTVDVAEGETTTVIPFAEKVPATDDKPEHWKIRILRLKQTEPEEKRQATFVSVSTEPELKVAMRDPDGSWNATFLKRFDTVEMPINHPEGYVPLKAGDRELDPIPVMDEGNYVVVLFDDPDGGITSINFRDYMHVTAD